LTFKQSVGQ